MNHLGHFLLTNLLMPALETAKRAGVVVVSSSLHDTDKARGKHRGSLLLPAATLTRETLLRSPDGFDGAEAYARSKLCNVLFALELQRRFQQRARLRKEPCSVYVNALSPGANVIRGGTWHIRYTHIHARITAHKKLTCARTHAGFIPATGLTRHAGRAGILFLSLLDSVRLLPFVGGITRSVEDGARCITGVCALSVTPVRGEARTTAEAEASVRSVSARPPHTPVHLERIDTVTSSVGSSWD